MPEASALALHARRKASIWTMIHPLFAIGQLLAFLFSVGLLIGFFRGAVAFHIVHVSVLIKIGLMVGAVITGSLWEHDMYGYWWFAPEFLLEDVMTLIVFIFQLSYLAVVAFHPDFLAAIVMMLCIAYTVYVINVAQYIHRTQLQKQQTAAALARLTSAAA